MTTTTISPYQRILLDTYCEGEMSHITTVEEAKNAGDTLFAFLFVELSADEDCDTINTACARVECARDQLEALAGKLLEASYKGVV